MQNPSLSFGERPLPRYRKSTAYVATALSYLLLMQLRARQLPLQALLHHLLLHFALPCRQMLLDLFQPSCHLRLLLLLLGQAVCGFKRMSYHVR